MKDFTVAKNSLKIIAKKIELLQQQVSLFSRNFSGQSLAFYFIVHLPTDTHINKCETALSFLVSNLGYPIFVNVTFWVNLCQ
jgi:hypothetical protein